MFLSYFTGSLLFLPVQPRYDDNQAAIASSGAKQSSCGKFIIIYNLSNNDSRIPVLISAVFKQLFFSQTQCYYSTIPDALAKSNDDD